MISIITSVFNCEKYINDFVKSIISQTYQNWELIIIDDCSTDLTYERLAQHEDARIKLFRNDINCGLTKNLNKALEIASGEYVIRMDGDDIALPTRFQLQIEYMDNNPKVALSGGWAYMFGLESGMMHCPLDEKRIRVRLLYDAAMLHPTFIIRKSIIDQYNIRYNEELRYAQDYDFEFQVSKLAHVANIPQLLIRYRIHDSQISKEKRDQQIKCANETRKKILEHLGITLTKAEMVVWSDFCNMLSSEEDALFILDDIIRRIIEANSRVDFFDQRLLRESLSYRRQIYEKNNLAMQNNAINKSGKYKEMFEFLAMFECSKNKQLIVSSWKANDRNKKIAIYGAGFIGKIIYDFLKISGINVLYFLDQNVEQNLIDEECEIYNLNDQVEFVDVIIVTPFYAFDSIKKSVEKIMKTTIISAEIFL